MGIKVSLRKKDITKDRKTLYLDFYPAIPHPKTGELTRREFLKLYIYNKPKNPIDKKHNEETLRLAELIRQKRENVLNKPEIYTEYEKEQLKIKELGELSFIDYFRKLANKRESSNKSNWLSALYYLETYTKGKLKFADVNEHFLIDFKDYLLSAKSKRSNKIPLSQNTASSYFNKVLAALKQAYKEDLLQKDIRTKVASIKTMETKREYLTIDELNVLVKTPCENELLKKAALFSALTGLRFSDIENLRWSDVEFIEGLGYSIKFQQQKTKGVEVLPISEQAYELMGEPQNSNNNIFEGLQYSAYHNKQLKQWIKDAGITKNISFHCFRHTYATMQLYHGTDIYTVSKMLGHRNVQTTQIYAKIVDDAKRKAANKIILDL